MSLRLTVLADPNSQTTEFADAMLTTNLRTRSRATRSVIARVFSARISGSNQPDQPNH